MENNQLYIYFDCDNYEYSLKLIYPLYSSTRIHLTIKDKDNDLLWVGTSKLTNKQKNKAIEDIENIKNKIKNINDYIIFPNKLFENKNIDIILFYNTENIITINCKLVHITSNELNNTKSIYNSIKKIDKRVYEQHKEIKNNIHLLKQFNIFIFLCILNFIIIYYYT